MTARTALACDSCSTMTMWGLVYVVWPVVDPPGKPGDGKGKRHTQYKKVYRMYRQLSYDFERLQQGGKMYLRRQSASRVEWQQLAAGSRA